MPWQIEDHHRKISSQTILDQMAIESRVVIVAVHDEGGAAHLFRGRGEVLARDMKSSARVTSQQMKTAGLRMREDIVCSESVVMQIRTRNAGGRRFSGAKIEFGQIFPQGVDIGISEHAVHPVILLLSRAHQVLAIYR